jgi:hypothetical protein
MPRVVLVLATLAITIYSVIDAIQTDEKQVQYLPKLIWIVLILLFTPIGGIAWLVTGRQRGPQSGRRGPNYPAAPRGPDDDPDFLRNL